MTYVDQPDKKMKNSKFQKNADKLIGEFTKTDFQKARELSTEKKLIKGFGRIGVCLNGKPTEEVPTEELDKVCFIICNTYTKADLKLGLGPFNDGYLIGLNFHKQGYKIFYLHNPTTQEFINYFQFFLTNTHKTLTVYYSGRLVSIPNSDPRLPNTTAIVFNEGQINTDEVAAIISENSSKNCKIILISECSCGGTICELTHCSNEGCHELPNVISISAKVSPEVVANQKMKAHKLQGLFTYYFCKVTSDEPGISPSHLEEMVNSYISRFEETAVVESANTVIESQPIFE